MPARQSCTLTCRCSSCVRLLVCLLASQASPEASITTSALQWKAFSDGKFNGKHSLIESTKGPCACTDSWGAGTSCQTSVLDSHQPASLQAMLQPDQAVPASIIAATRSRPCCLLTKHCLHDGGLDFKKADASGNGGAVSLATAFRSCTLPWHRRRYQLTTSIDASRMNIADLCCWHGYRIS